MSKESFLDYLVVGGIVLLCIGLLVRYIKQAIFPGTSAKERQGCSDRKD